MIDEAGLRQTMVHVARVLADRGLVCAGEGNLSARLDADRLLCTPGGMRKGEIAPADLVIVDLAGRKLAGTRSPSSELLMHLEVYRRRADVNAVVHAHPAVATAFTIAGRTLDIPMMPETVVMLNRIAVAPYGMPGTPELPATLAGIIERHDVVLLDHHGAIACGLDLIDALNKMETLEKHAVIAAAALQLGGITPLPPAEVAKLDRWREEVWLPKLRAQLRS